MKLIRLVKLIQIPTKVNFERLMVTNSIEIFGKNEVIDLNNKA